MNNIIETADIEVNEPETLTHNTDAMETTKPDLSSLSLEELQAAIETKKQEKETAREAYKGLVKETVPQAIDMLFTLSNDIAQAKKDIFKYFIDVLSLKKEVYGTKENQQSHTFSTDHAEVTIGYRINDGWDDTVSAGIQKVTKFISSLAKDDNSAALVETVFNLLKKDAKGNLKGSRVLELQKLTAKFNNEEFTDGVKIISDAYKPVRSCWFVEAYTIGDSGEKKSIPLSMSSVDFPEGFTFDFN